MTDINEMVGLLSEIDKDRLEVSRGCMDCLGSSVADKLLLAIQDVLAQIKKIEENNEPTIQGIARIATARAIKLTITNRLGGME